MGKPEGDFGQTSDAGAWSRYLPEPYLPVISQEGETYLVPICEGGCACVLSSCAYGYLESPEVGWEQKASPPASLAVISLRPLSLSAPSPSGWAPGTGWLSGLSHAEGSGPRPVSAGAPMLLAAGRMPPPKSAPLGLVAGPQSGLPACPAPGTAHPALAPALAPPRTRRGPARAHLPLPECLFLLFLLLFVTLGCKLANKRDDVRKG